MSLFRESAGPKTPRISQSLDMTEFLQTEALTVSLFNVEELWKKQLRVLRHSPFIYTD